MNKSYLYACQKPKCDFFQQDVYTPFVSLQCLYCGQASQPPADSKQTNDNIVSRDKQVGGNHYKDHAIQPWDIIIEYKLNYFEGNVLKYLLRNKTNRLEDLTKALHYLEQTIHLLKKEKQ
jgi:hypothetical protein